jgi:cation transport regulator ChaB
MNWMRHKSSAEELNEFLRHVAPELANNIQRLVHCSAQEQVDAYCCSQLESMNTVTVALPVANASVASLAESSKNKMKQGGDTDY